jgi:polyketide biosynthesis acyl carrier protein
MTTNDAVMSALRESVCEVMLDLDPEQVVESASLRELGTNSVDRADILMLTMERLQRPLPMVAFARCQNLGEIAQVLSLAVKDAS